MALDLPPKPELWLPPRPAVVRAWKRKELRRGSFLPGMFPCGAGALAAVAAPPTRMLTASSGSASNSSSYTFASQSLGTAATGRLIVVCVSDSALAGATTLTGITIGGNAASLVRNEKGTDGVLDYFAAVGQLVVDAGTSASIVVTFSGTQQRCGIAVYALYGLASSTAAASNGAASSSTTLNIPAHGIAVAAAYGEAAMTAGGLTEDAQVVLEAGAYRLLAMSAENMSAETGRSISSSGGGGRAAIAAASWV